MRITIENLTKKYSRGTLALNDVSFEIGGGVFGLLGRNGAGKTTLMRIVATAIKQSSGRVLFDGKEIDKNIKEFRSRLGYLPQSSALMPNMNIYEFLDYMCVLKGINQKSKRLDEIERCVEIVGLEDEKKKHLRKYSGGMLRRAGIAQALLGSPDLLIIDEPTTGLDPEERLYFLNLLSRISYKQTTLLSTHIIHDIESICQNVCVLEHGNLMYAGSTSDMVLKQEGRVWQIECDPGKEEEIKGQATVVSVAYNMGKPTVRYLADDALFENSVSVTATLEDAYIGALGGVKR